MTTVRLKIPDVPTHARPLAGLRVPVAEDDFAVASDISTALAGAGAVVLGPCADAPATMHQIQNAIFDCGVIDLDLGHGVNFVIASALYAARIPIVFVTGYRQSLIPAHLADRAQFLPKPLDLPALIEAVAASQRAPVSDTG